MNIFSTTRCTTENLARTKDAVGDARTIEVNTSVVKTTNGDWLPSIYSVVEDTDMIEGDTSVSLLMGSTNESHWMTMEALASSPTRIHRTKKELKFSWPKQQKVHLLSILMFQNFLAEEPQQQRQHPIHMLILSCFSQQRKHYQKSLNGWKASIGRNWKKVIP